MIFNFEKLFKKIIFKLAFRILGFLLISIGVAEKLNCLIGIINSDNMVI